MSCGIRNYSGVMYHCNGERIFEIGPVIFVFIRYKQYKHTKIQVFSLCYVKKM